MMVDVSGRQSGDDVIKCRILCFLGHVLINGLIKINGIIQNLCWQGMRLVMMMRKVVEQMYLLCHRNGCCMRRDVCWHLSWILFAVYYG